MKISIIALNTFREAVRNKIMYTAVLFAIILVGMSAFFGSVSVGSQEQVILDFGLFALSFFGAALAIVAGVSLLNKELKQKTIYNILSKPVARWQFIVGKYLGLGFTVSMLVAVMGIGLSLFLFLMQGTFNWLLYQAIFFIILEVLVVAAITIFFSSIVVTTTLTGLFTLGTYLAGRSINYLTYFVSGEGATSPALASVVKVLDNVLPDLSVFNVNDAIVFGHAVTASHFVTAIIYAISYIVILLIIASWIFRYRELN